MLAAGSALANMSAPQAGPQATLLQLITGGLQGYNSGANNTLNSFYANQGAQADLMKSQSAATMAGIQAQRAQQYFSPTAKGNGMAAALSPQPQGMGAPQGMPQGQPSLQSFYGGAAHTMGGTPTGSSGRVTAFGADVPTMARQLYQQGMDTMMAGQSGGDKLIEQAIQMDPSIVYEKSFASESGKSAAGLPFEIAKIQATGSESRKTSGYDAGLRPREQQIMVDGKLVTVPSNDSLVAQGLPPPNISAFGNAPTGGAANGVLPPPPNFNTPLQGMPPAPNISTAIPVGAKEAAIDQAKNVVAGVAEVNKSLNDLQSFSNSLASFKDAISQTNYTGQVAGRVGGVVSAPGRTDLVSAQNEVTLRAKGLLGMPSANFSDSDREFLRSIAGGQYGRQEGLNKVVDRLNEMTDKQAQYLESYRERLKNSQDATYTPTSPATAGWSVRKK